MSNKTTVQLDAPDVTHYHVQGRQVWVRTLTHEVVVRVPKAVKAVYWPRGERAVIHVGSLTISGPMPQVQGLWDTICDTTPTK